MLDGRSVGWLVGSGVLGIFVGMLLGFLIWGNEAAPGSTPAPPTRECRRAVEAARDLLQIEAVGPELSDEYLDLLRRANQAAAELDTLALEDLLVELERLNNRLRDALERGSTARFEIFADRCLSG